MHFSFEMLARMLVTGADLRKGRGKGKRSGKGRTAMSAAGREKRPWTDAEDAALRAAVRIEGNRWVKVAARVGGGRNDRSCRTRWTRDLGEPVPTAAAVGAALQV